MARGRLLEKGMTCGVFKHYKLVKSYYCNFGLKFPFQLCTILKASAWKMINIDVVCDDTNKQSEDKTAHG